MYDDGLQSSIDVPFQFVLRPMSLPADLRPHWRIAVTLLILQVCCRGGRSHFDRLHALHWAIRNRDAQQVFLEALSGFRVPDEAIIRREPWVNRAIDLAQGEQLVVVHNGTVALTAKGIAAALELNADQTLLRAEKEFLTRVKRLVTETRIDELLSGGHFLGSENP